MSRPALPPRSIPPPPPPVVEPPLAGLAARIASLNLDQVHRNPVPNAKPPPPKRTAPPPPPRHNSGHAPSPPPRPASNAPSLPPRRDSQLAKALSRPPPPPPSAPKPPPLPTRASSTPSLPSRRLPPMPARLPTPEPEPEPEPEPYEQAESSCIKCHDFSHVDAHAANFPRQSVASVRQLAYDLTSPFESETEKARAIFFWLHLNIAYDAVSFFSGNISAATGESTLRSGLAVCDGYAGMFVELAEHAGLQVLKVVGHGKGFGYSALAPGAPVPPESSNHAWNCVLMDGEWRLLDACWGAGALDGGSYIQRFAPNWFYFTAAEFGKRHFPTDPSYQLVSGEEGGPVSWEEYILAPEGPTIFNDFHTLEFSQDLLQPPLAEIHASGGGWVSFHLFKHCEHMSREEADNYVYFIAAPDDTKTPLQLNAEGGWSASIYMARGLSGDVSLNFLTKLDGRDAKGVSAHTFKSSVGRKSMAWQGLAKWRLV